MDQRPARQSIRKRLSELHGLLRSEGGIVRPIAGAGLFGLVGAFLLYLVLSAGGSTATNVQAEGTDRMTICHYDRNQQGPNAGPHEITISENAVQQHLDNHVKKEGFEGDDSIGKCPEEKKTEEPTVTATAEDTATPTEEPTSTPTEEPTATPTEEAGLVPTEEPTTAPTEEPTIEITIEAVAPAVEEPTALPPAAPVEIEEPAAAVSEVAPAVATSQPVQALPATGSGGLGASGDAPVWLFPVLLAGFGGLAWYVKRANRA
jgi:hypothetical protein